MDNDESDTDRRGVYLAPAELQWSLFGAPEQFEDNASQSCYWELQKFLAMALKANPNILECLYSPMIEKMTSLGEELMELREKFLSQMMFQTFNGYAMSQFKKIEQDIRNHNPGINLDNLPADNSIEFNPTVLRSNSHIQPQGSLRRPVRSKARHGALE